MTLDSVKEEKALRDHLRANSGFGITHVGKLAKEEGVFSAKEAAELLDALSWYLSFCAGRWTGPCLQSGFAADQAKLWDAWSYSRTSQFRRSSSWCDRIHPEHVEDAWPGFLKLWQDDVWQEVIRVAVHWYVEANAQAGSIEGAIVLTQTAFELLASAVLVENHSWLSSEGYEKLSAADRIRLLLLWAGIPTEIPSNQSVLTQQAKADNWPDSSTALTQIRNTITHPTKKNRKKFGKHLDGARTEAWNVGLWLLELCLLRLFDYSGTYGSRIEQRYVGDVQNVPWCDSLGSQS